MVKRKRVGSCSVQDEKRQDEGMTLHVQREGIKASDQKQLAQDPCTSQQVNTSRGRSQHHVSRTAGTQNQPGNDASNQEEGMTSLDKQPSKCVIAQRSSIRISKRPRKDTSPPVVQPVSKKPASKQSTPPDQSKTRRSWELWSVEDKNAFFEALCEYGKDFESIQSYIAQRSKKKGVPPNMIKNKDQVRHFYYRTWHKISKHLNIGEDVKKQTQELYGLINYAELRKKIGGCLNEKNRQKLNELVFNGVTIVKYRGKKLRIKTPVCRALKKLNNIADTKEPEVQKLPKEILVEFRPQSNAAWLHVQNLAQNPRVRTKLCLQKRLKTVIDYLQKRWQPLRLKRKEQILTSLPSSAIPPLPPDPCPLLRVRPKRDAAFSLLSISAVDVASSTDVCLENYLKNTLKECKEKENIKSKKGATRTKSKTTSSETKAVTPVSESHTKTAYNTIDDKAVRPLQSVSEEQQCKEEKQSHLIDSAAALLTPPKSVPDHLDSGENPVDEAQRSLSMLTDMLNSMDDNCHTQQNTNYMLIENEQGISEQQTKVQNPLAPECRTIEELYLNTQPNVDHMTLGQLLGLATEKKQQCPNEDVTEVDSDKTPNVLPSFTTGPEDKNDRTVKISESAAKEDLRNEIENGRLAARNEMEKLQKGWTVSDVGILTVGELYLKLGCPEKIVLEYDWEQPEDHKSSESHNASANLVDKISEKGQLQKLAEVLRKLVQVASTTFADFKNKQQVPVSPTHRGGGHSRTSTTSPSGKSSTSRGSSRSPSVRAGTKVASGSTSKSKAVDKTVACKEATSTASQASSETHVHTPTLSGNAPIDSSNITGEKHVFVVPVGTAPRTVKQPSAESVREQLDKLIPTSRRGCRTRRKPLVVQRPLLPREGMGTVASPRPMAVVHLVPSSSQLSPLAAVIPSGSATSSTVSKVALPQAKKVVKIVPTGAPIDVRPIQVPLLKPVDTSGNANVVLPTTNLSTAHLVMATSSVASPLATVQTPEPEVMSTPSLVVPAITAGSSILHQVKGDSEQSVLIQRTTEQALSPSVPVIVNASSPPQVEALPLNVLSSSSKAPTLSTICITTTCTSSPPQISIPETAPSGTSTISPPSITSLLEMSLVEGTYLPSEAMPDHASEHLLDFSESSNSSLPGVFGLAASLTSNKMTARDASVSIPTCLSSDPVVAPRHTTPPNSPPTSHFRISSPGPEGQWLNGESADFSLSSLLNTLESPSKAVPVSSSSSSLTTDNSNLTSIVRLAPDVDSQLQCLMNESSVDYMAKFADLAAQITSSATDSKPA